jgi:hypothetical protein
MTILAQCDRCKKIGDNKQLMHRGFFEVSIRGPNSKTRYGLDEDMYLCEPCFDAFSDFIGRNLVKN